MTVIQQAYVQGVSTRKMAALAHAMGIDGLDKSAVSRICQDLDAQVAAFRARPFHDAMPYVCVDASYLNIRQNHRIVSHALLVAVGIDMHGNRHILDVGLCAGEDATSWETFLAGMVARGLHGVSLVTSDAHRGLQQAIRTVFVGSSWQRCTVHVMRNILTHIAHRDKKMVAALLKTVFVQPTIHDAQAQLTVVAQQLETRWSKPAARVLRDAEADMMTYLHYPAVHQQRIRTTNIVERLNREIKRRSKVVSVFPDQESALRLIGSVLIAEDDDWRTRRGYFTQKSMREIGVATP
jgi:transposase-like protein